jgi:hypothetical protein
LEEGLRFSNRRTASVSLAGAATALIGLLLVAGLFASAARASVPTFEARASSSVPLTAVAADPSTGLVYAQENNGTAFFVYDPATDSWSGLAPSPINSENNGGATYLEGEIYVVYTGNEDAIAVYDIATNTWDTIKNPLAEGTGDITAVDGKVYLAVGQKFLSYDPATEESEELGEPPAFPQANSNCNEEGFEPWGGLQPDGEKIYGHQGDGCDGFAVYDIPTDEWTELAPVPIVITEFEENGTIELEEEAAVLGSAIDPVTHTYLAYGPYGGTTLFKYDLDGSTWSTGTLPFAVEDGGMAYVSLPGHEGTYMIQGEEDLGFTRYFLGPDVPPVVPDQKKTTPPPPPGPTPQCVVPKLKGLTVKKAKKALGKAGCKAGKVTHHYSGKVKKGKVVSGGKAGKVLAAGSKVKLSVSRGEKPQAQGTP